jgi:hypothetical protein
MKRSAQSASAEQRSVTRRSTLNTIELLRLRVAAAAKTLNQAKQQARHAKARRKLAKLLAKRAKDNAKTAKMELTELRESLANAKARAAALKVSSRGFKKTTRAAVKKISASQPAVKKKFSTPKAAAVVPTVPTEPETIPESIVAAEFVNAPASEDASSISKGINNE